MNTWLLSRSFCSSLWFVLAVVVVLSPTSTHAQAVSKPAPFDNVLGGLLKHKGVQALSREQRRSALRQRGLGFEGDPAAQLKADALRKRASAGSSTRREADSVGLLVRFRGAETRAAASANQQPPQALISAVLVAAGVQIEYARPMSLGFFVFRFPAPLSNAEAEAVRRRVELLDQVEIADLNIKMKSTLVPNDPLGTQYQYSLAPTSLYAGGIDAPGAWDYTRGTSNTVVAVLDTGITNHPEFAGRLLPGADLIADSARSLDGNGRDLDAADAGDWQPATAATSNCPQKPSSWHGTHVTGIIAANTNNRLGIAGIDWNARIVPVRVLGRCGGDWSDILDGFLWAIGQPVPGVPAINSNPAHIINMSLSGAYPGGCPQVAQLAIQQAKARGTLVVVAAGNDDVEITEQIPASCEGVITVGAVDHLGLRASYSNYSTRNKVFVSAPGGDSPYYGREFGVVSTINSGATVPAEPSYDFKSGTSMAAPHVSGIASLALSANSNLNNVELAALLQLTASPFPSGSQCEIYYPLCGEGIANAKGMVQGAVALLPYRVVTEFYNNDNGHYFRTGDRDEPSIVESGQVGNWVNTEDYFVAWRDGSSGASPVCRFYSYKFNSHFYTANPAECDAVKRNTDWVFESIAFYAKVPLNDVCPADSVPIHRFYNNRQNYGDGNHRFTPYGDYYGATLRNQGWTYEGVGMCAVSVE